MHLGTRGRGEGRAHVGLGYDSPRFEELDTVQELMTRHGLLFDPNDRVKALRGLRPRIPDARVVAAAPGFPLLIPSKDRVSGKESK